MTAVTVSGVQDFAALEIRWRDLERRATPSFFQSWTWTGCLAGERFTDPVLVEAAEQGRTVALALFNQFAVLTVRCSQRPVEDEPLKFVRTLYNSALRRLNSALVAGSGAQAL